MPVFIGGLKPRQIVPRIDAEIRKATHRWCICFLTSHGSNAGLLTMDDDGLVELDDFLAWAPSARYDCLVAAPAGN